MSASSRRAGHALLSLVAVLTVACGTSTPVAAPPPPARTGSTGTAAPAGTAPGTEPQGTVPPGTEPTTSEPATTAPPPTETVTTPVPTTTTTLPTTTTTIPCIKIHVVCPPTGVVPTTTFHAPIVTVTETPTDVYTNYCGPAGTGTRAYFSISVDPGADSVRITWTIDGKPGSLSATLGAVVGGPNNGMFYNATFDAMQLAPKLAAPSERVDFTVSATNGAGTGTAHTTITLWRCGPG